LKPYLDLTDPSLAKALAHPLRTRILAALEDRTASPSDLADEIDAPLGVLSYHVRRLEALGLLELVERVPRRGALEHYYTAVARPRITNDTWGATPTIVKQATIGAALQEVASHVNAAAADGGFDQAESHLTRSPVRVDQQGWRALACKLDALLPDVQQIEAESQERLRRADHQDEQEATVVLMLFNPSAIVPETTAPKGNAVAHRARRRQTSGA
jgi:DNA-binding transcriptional ArsR family regulator